MTIFNPVIFTAHLEPVKGPMVHHVIIVPDEIAGNFIKERGPARILCAIKNKAGFHCALMPRHGRYVIIASKELIKVHKLQIGTPFDISIQTDPHNGLELPEELSEVLEQDEFGYKVYMDLPDGEKRGFIYYIRQAKSIDTRIKRCIEILEKIKLRSITRNKNSL